MTILCLTMTLTRCISGDGDSKAYDALVEAQPYGPDVVIDREECVNHADKRMGAALLKLSKEQKLGGNDKKWEAGRLTQAKALKFQAYYGRAIRNNVNNPDGMRRAVWASLLHCMSTDDSPHHTRCPDGSESWCYFKRAKAAGEEPGPHDKNVRNHLSYEVAQAMLPVYHRMSEPNLLQRLSKVRL